MESCGDSNSGLRRHRECGQSCPVRSRPPFLLTAVSELRVAGGELCPHLTWPARRRSRELGAILLTPPAGALWGAATWRAGG